jgi:two-component system OmpR family response regulator
MTDQPHILIVDDDREIRALLAKYLETNSFRTTAVADGKPFNPRELLVRIKAVLRRAAHAPRDPDAALVRNFRFGGWQLNTTTRTLTDSEGASVALSGAEYRLLTVLLGSPSRVLSRSQLATLLRGREADPQDRSIDVRVSRLRQLLGDDARASQIIKTVYGEGYVIGVGVETA